MGCTKMTSIWGSVICALLPSHFAIPSISKHNRIVVDIKQGLQL